MFSLIYKNQIQLGPIAWSKVRFTDELEELEIEHEVLPFSNTAPFTINQDTHILPTTTQTPVFDITYENLTGPVANITDTSIVLVYGAEDKPVDQIKSNLKQVIAHNRWRYEIQGATVEIQGNSVWVPSAKGDRDIFLQSMQVGIDGVNWKFGELWLVLTNADLQTIVTAILAKVQTAFDWEASKVLEIDTCVDITELKLVVLENASWEPVNPPAMQDPAMLPHEEMPIM